MFHKLTSCILIRGRVISYINSLFDQKHVKFISIIDI